jgi:iron-sulfur cluster repair protein YtfE (RIC family)
MIPSRQTSRALYDEHQGTLELLGRVVRVLAPNAPVTTADAQTVRVATALGEHLRHDLRRHFAFEEDVLFARIADAGGGDLRDLLAEEHETINAVVAELVPLCASAAAAELDAAGWSALRRGALELADRLMAHIEKEDGALLPMVDDLLDDETDRELAFAYASS